MEFTYKAAKDLLEMFGGEEDEEATITVEFRKDFPTPGLYGHFTEYREEGYEPLGFDCEPQG